MSYDIRLLDPVSKEVIELNDSHHMHGGTYALGGTAEAWLNITYNYGKFYTAFGSQGIRAIYGMIGAESIPLIRAAAATLGDDVSDDYWEATEGNAKRPLMQLIALATMRPDGVWDGN